MSWLRPLFSIFSATTFVLGHHPGSLVFTTALQLLTLLPLLFLPFISFNRKKEVIVLSYAYLGLIPPPPPPYPSLPNALIKSKIIKVTTQLCLILSLAFSTNLFVLSVLPLH